MACLLLLLVLTVVLGSSSVSAHTWYIKPDGSGDAPTIQAGIDSSATGDTVLVASGTYRGQGNRAINFKGRDVILRSESGRQATLIDCEDTDRALILISGETSGAVVQGITVLSAYSANDGGAVLCVDSSPTIVDCTIANSTSAQYGGGLYCNTSSVTLIDCTFSGDSARRDGGGLCCSESSPMITNCTFTDNSSGGYAGGLFCTNYSSPAITGCVFLNNSAPVSGGAISCNYYSSPAVTNCTLYANSGGMRGVVDAIDSSEPTLVNSIIAFSTSGGAVWCSLGQVALSCCDVYGNAGGDWVGCIAGQNGVNGNFSADPKFCDTWSANLTVEDCSPCLGGHHPDEYDCSEFIGALGSGCGCGAARRRATWGAIKSMYK